MTATAAQFQVLLEPGLSNIWHDAFDEVPSSFGQIFNIRDMSKVTITEAKMAGFGQPQVQNAGAEVTFDDPIAPVETTYTYEVRGLGYKIHEQLWINDLYGEVNAFEQDLMSAMRDDTETSAWSVFNNGFGTTNTGFDALQLFSTAHTRLDGGAVQANRPSTDAALSVAALQSAIITQRKTLNDRGRFRVHTPRQLVVPLDLGFTAREILRSTQLPGTANNDVNAVREFNLKMLEVHYLTSTTSWFLIADKHDLNWFWRFQAKTGSETEFKTDTILRKARHAYAFGFGEWRGTYGTDGVA